VRTAVANNLLSALNLIHEQNVRQQNFFLVMVAATHNTALGWCELP
jgi:hypothetical protein